MSLDGFLTFLGLMIATYAILNPISRLRLRLHAFRQYFLAATALILCAYFEFYFEIRSIFPETITRYTSPISFEKTSELTNNEAAFLVVAAWIALSTLLHITARPTALSLKPLLTLCERLRDEGRYLAIVNLSEPYMPVLKRAHNKQLPLQNLHHRLRNYYLQSILPISFEGDEKTKSRERLAKLSKLAAILVPERKSTENAANNILRILYESDGIRQVLVRLKPEFALELITVNSWEASDFRTRFFRDLLNDSGSHFFAEISNNQNTEGMYGRALNPENKILFGLLNDASIADNIGIWKPIGDEINRLIARNPHYKERLNQTSPSDEELLSDPTYCAIDFFHIMVTQAAKQKIISHMWLMYMSTFVRSLVEVHEPDPNSVDCSDEFPCLADRLIYEITRRQRDWILMATELSEGNPHVDNIPENINTSVSIPYWAMKDYASTMRFLVYSNKIQRSQLVALWESCINTIGKLPENGSLSFLRSKLIDILIDGDQYGTYGNLRASFSSLSAEVDHCALWHVEDLVAKMGHSN